MFRSNYDLFLTKHYAKLVEFYVTNSFFRN